MNLSIVTQLFADPDPSMPWLMFAAAVIGLTSAIVCIGLAVIIPRLVCALRAEWREWFPPHSPRYVIRAQRHNATRLASPDDAKRRAHLNALVDFQRFQRRRIQ